MYGRRKQKGSAQDVTSRSGSTDEGGRYVGRKLEVPTTGLFVWARNSCTDRETGGEATGSRYQLGSGNMQCKREDGTGVNERMVQV